MRNYSRKFGVYDDSRFFGDAMRLEFQIKLKQGSRWDEELSLQLDIENIFARLVVSRVFLV